jgi:hypothetical protein
VSRALAIGVLLATIGCADPPATEVAPPITIASVDGVRVHVGGREVVVHCALTCPATQAELTRLSSECVSNPSSGPHRVSPGGALLVLGCCEEASLAYERGCGHEGLPGCAQTWTGTCQGIQPAERAVPEDDRGVTSGRGTDRSP